MKHETKTHNIYKIESGLLQLSYGSSMYKKLQTHHHFVQLVIEGTPSPSL